LTIEGPSPWAAAVFWEVVVTEERRLAGRVAIVSGGARGIGAATARLLVEHGARVVIGDLLEDEGRQVVKELGPEVALFTPLDVRSEAAWDAAVAIAEASFGPPTILVNNAGVMVVGPVEMATADQFRIAYEVNVIGAFLGIRSVLDAMKAAGGGSIVVLSSAAGCEGTFGLPAYAASKAANASLAKTAAMELGHYGIRVNAIAPGGIDTAMSNAPEFEGMDRDAWYGNLPISRIGQVDEVARVALFLACDDSSYLTGSVVTVDGGHLAGHKAL